MASAGSRRVAFFLRRSWPPLAQIACAVAREDIIFSTSKQYPSTAVVVLLNYGTGAEERRVLLALFVWAVIQRSNTNPAQLINTGSRERRGRNNDAVKSGFMNMEQCLILHYYGCYLKHTPCFCAGDCYFLSSVWIEPVIVLIEALKDFSWNEIENTKGRILDQFLEGAVVRRVQK